MRNTRRHETLAFLSDLWHLLNMEQENIPTTAYDLLTQQERLACDDYIMECTHRYPSIITALDFPIPNEFIARSRGLLSKPLVRAAIAQKIHELSFEQDLNPQRLVKELETIAYSNLGDFIEGLPFGDFQLKDLKTIPRSKMSAVKSIKATPSPWGNRVEVVLHDKIASLNRLTEILDMRHTPRTKDGGKVEQIESEQEYMKMLEGLKEDALA